MISISLYNPIRFLNIGDFDFLRNFDCSKYFQKWQRGDQLNIQFLANEPVNLSVRDLTTKAEIRSILAIQQQSGLSQPNFNIYEASLNFDDTLEQGWYYLQVIDSDGGVAISYPFEYLYEHPETLLIRYYNSENKTGMIFETGIDLFIRVEGVIFDFMPSSDSDVYFDQSKDPVLLNSVPYRVFTLNIGRNKGVSEWMADMVNYAFSCDYKHINGKSFERNEGSDFEPVRVDNSDLMGMNIEIVQKKNKSSIDIKSIFIIGDSDDNAITDNNNFIGNGY